MTFEIKITNLYSYFKYDDETICTVYCHVLCKRFFCEKKNLEDIEKYVGEICQMC